MIQTEPANIADPVAIGVEVTAGPFVMRVDEAIIADAGAMIADISEQNNDAPEGLSFVLASITVGNTGSQPLPISVTDFPMTGTDGVLRRCPSLALPDPSLNVLLQPDKVFTGWTAGLVNDLSNVITLFDPAISVGPRFAATAALTDGAALPTFETTDDGPNDVGTSIEAPASLGEAVRTDAWDITITETVGSDIYYELSDYRVRALGPPVGGSDSWLALGLDITIKNASNTPNFFSWTALELVDDGGVPWDHLLAMTQPIPPASVELLPGASSTGWYGIWLQSWATTSLLRFTASVSQDDSRYISLDGTTGQLTSDSESATPEPNVTETLVDLDLAPGDIVQVGDDPLNLRGDASAEADVVVELDPGTQLAVTGDLIEAGGYRWYPVEVVETGETGFIADNFVTPVEN